MLSEDFHLILTNSWNNTYQKKPYFKFFTLVEITFNLNRNRPYYLINFSNGNNIIDFYIVSF